MTAPETRDWFWFWASLTARILLGTAAVAVLWSIVPIPFGWTSVVVVSGSMGPRIRAGDVAIASPVEPARVVPGQPVLVDNPARPGRLLLHRVVDRHPDGSLITKGDANAAQDSTPVPPQSVRGLPRLLVRYIGLPVYWYGEGEHRKTAATGLVVVLLSMLAAKRLDDDSGTADDPAIPHRSGAHRAGRHSRRRHLRPVSAAYAPGSHRRGPAA